MIGNHESDHIAKFRTKLINEMNKFKYLGSILPKNEGIVNDVASIIKCG